MIIIVQHKVRDYDTWKSAFDEHGDVRRRHGATGHELYQGLDDPNEITIVSHFPSAAGRGVRRRPVAEQAMEQGGVTSEPRITWAQEAEAVDYKAKAA